MPSRLPTRRPARRSKLSAAELEFLTGEPQAERVNPFERIRLSLYTNQRKELEHVQALVDRATFLPAARQAELRRMLDKADREITQAERAKT